MSPYEPRPEGLNTQPAPPSIVELLQCLRYEADSGELYWIATKSPSNLVGTRAGSVNDDGYRRVMFGGRSLPAHRIAWALHNGAWPSKWVDHIDGNRSNNSIQNLRLAEPNQNAHNMRLRKSNVSGAKGVSWHKSTGRWQASIRCHFRKIHLGLFDSVDEAAHAYNKAAIELHGEFAVLNLVGGDYWPENARVPRVNPNEVET